MNTSDDRIEEGNNRQQQIEGFEAHEISGDYTCLMHAGIQRVLTVRVVVGKSGVHDTKVA